MHGCSLHYALLDTTLHVSSHTQLQTYLKANVFHVRDIDTSTRFY